MTETHLDIGSIIYISVKPIFKIYIIMTTGFFLARKNILTVDTSRNISALAITILLPCLVFNSIVTNIQNSDIAEIGTIVLVAATFILMGGLCSLLIALTTGCPKSWLGGAMTVGLFPNLSDLPIAYLQTLETTGIFTADQVAKGTAYICISVAVEVIFQFNCGGYRLNGWDFRYAIRKAQTENEISNASLKDLNSTTTDEEAVIGNSSSSSDENNTNTNDKQTERRDSEDAMSTISSLDDERDTPLHDISDQEDKAHLNFIRQRASKTNNSISGTSANGTSTGRRLTLTNSIRSTATNDDNLRGLPSQTMNDVVKVYSRFEDLAQADARATETFGDLTVKKVETNKTLPISTTTGSGHYEVNEDLSIYQEMIIEIKKAYKNMSIQNIGKSIWSLIKMIIMSSFRPLSITTIVAIVICMIPWLKALFVKNDQVTLPSAPDSDPPLSFIMDTVSYLGQAQVPIGLLMLGATISRIELNKLPKGAWRTPVALVIMRLCIFPIIGVSINSRLEKAGLFYDDTILQFVCNLDWCTPPATALLYLTAFYSPKDSEEHTQMDCLALTYIMSYIVLVIALPFTVTYTLVHQLKF